MRVFSCVGKLCGAPGKAGSWRRLHQFVSAEHRDAVAKGVWALARELLKLWVPAPLSGPQSCGHSREVWFVADPKNT